VGAGPEIRGHEFHHSRLEGCADELAFAYRVVRGHGLDGTRDGLVYRNVLASYAHLRDTSACIWTRPFVEFVRSCRVHSQTPRRPRVHLAAG
jgi:cobyrinic acid a,c-diamide synthase